MPILQREALIRLPMSPPRRAVKILGSEVDVVDMDDAVARMQGWIDARDGQCRQVVVSGFHAVWEAHRDPAYKHIVNSAAMWLADGIAPVWIARMRGMRGGPHPRADLMEAFLAKADMAGYRSYFYGDTEATLATLADKLQKQYLGHRIAGMLAPPFRALDAEEDERTCRRSIGRSRTFCGSGWERPSRTAGSTNISIGCTFRWRSGWGLPSVSWPAVCRGACLDRRHGPGVGLPADEGAQEVLAAVFSPGPAVHGPCGAGAARAAEV